jgi:hypothetical protein
LRNNNFPLRLAVKIPANRVGRRKIGGLAVKIPVNAARSAPKVDSGAG